MLVKYELNFSKLQNTNFSYNDFMNVFHHFSKLSDISFEDLQKYMNDFVNARLLKQYTISDKIRSILNEHDIDILITKTNIIVMSDRIFGFNFTSRRYIDFTNNQNKIIIGENDEWDAKVYTVLDKPYTIKCVYTNANVNKCLHYIEYK